MFCAGMTSGPPQYCQGYNSRQQYAAMKPILLASPITEHQCSAGSTKRGRGQEGGHQQLQQQQQQHDHHSQQDAKLSIPCNQIPNQAAQTSHELPLPESLSKRPRQSTYEAPRTVRPSILTATGSLVGGLHFAPQAEARGSYRHAPNSTAVPLRRQLSSGVLDPYIGGHDSMDLETGDISRPRSMSF